MRDVCRNPERVRQLTRVRCACVPAATPSAYALCAYGTLPPRPHGLPPLFSAISGMTGAQVGELPVLHRAMRETHRIPDVKPAQARTTVALTMAISHHNQYTQNLEGVHLTPILSHFNIHHDRHRKGVNVFHERLNERCQILGFRFFHFKNEFVVYL